MTDRYEALRKAAEGATPGPWTLTIHTSSEPPEVFMPYEGDDWTLSQGGKTVIAMEDGFRSGNDVRYVALANPAAILELLAERDALKHDIERHLGICSSLEAERDDARKERDEAIADRNHAVAHSESMKADAKRYRKLRRGKSLAITIPLGKGKETIVITANRPEKNYPECLDKCLDEVE